MVKFCASPLPFIFLAVIFVILLGLTLKQVYKRRQSRLFGGQGTGLLLALLVVGLASMAMFITYIVGSRTGC
jgi:uncharacterized membrane protein